jgi:uncharacterized protein YeaO (DUF488 family)
MHANMLSEQAMAPSAPKTRYERCTSWVAPIRPDAATQRRQLSAYKKQVHELRVQYIKELETKKQVEQESKKAASRLSDTDLAAYAKARAEHAEAKKVRLAERMKAIQKYKDERKLETQISFNAASTKRVCPLPLLPPSYSIPCYPLYLTCLSNQVCIISSA